MEVLKNVTDNSKGAPATAPAGEEKYKVVAPETMQENFMSDSEDEGGKFATIAQINNINRFFIACQRLISYSWDAKDAKVSTSVFFQNASVFSHKFHFTFIARVLSLIRRYCLNSG